MIDTMRTEFPSDMARVAEHPGMGSLESMATDVVDQLKDYARANPIAFASWAFGIGFVLGWKLKPW